MLRQDKHKDLIQPEYQVVKTGVWITTIWEMACALQ